MHVYKWRKPGSELQNKPLWCTGWRNCRKRMNGHYSQASLCLWKKKTHVVSKSLSYNTNFICDTAAVFRPCRTPSSTLGCRWCRTACRCCPAISWSAPPSSRASIFFFSDTTSFCMMLKFLLSCFASCHDRSLSSVTVFSVPRRAASSFADSWKSCWISLIDSSFFDTC